MPSNAQRYRSGLGIALFFAMGAGAGAWLACGAANQHDQGEVCSPYAQGSGGDSDGGFTQGDCKACPNCPPTQRLACVCEIGGDAGCLCAPQCAISDGGATCGSGYSCTQARDVVQGSTSLFCFPTGS